MLTVFSFRRLVAIAMIAMLALGGAVIFGVRAAVNSAVAVDAEHKALSWASYFLDTMPDLNALLLSGELNPEQKAVLAKAEKIGDIFRFKLFDRKGGLVLVSDGTTYGPEAERETSEKAVGVAQTGKSNISLNDGTTKKDRPPLYVEAYVPINDAAGKLTGIVEVYLDQTETEALLKRTFTALAFVLALAAALAFGVPTLAFLYRSRQASEARKQVEFLAHHDPMTSLMNRASFAEALSARLVRSRDDGIAVIVIDADDFKAINDTYGHEGGDEFLRHVARHATRLCGEMGHVARLGGDEFALVLPGSEQQAKALIEQLIDAVKQPVSFNGRSIAGQISAGLHVSAGGTVAAADLIHKAEIALYQAKIDGGNVYRQFSEEMEVAIQRRRELEQMLREATRSKAFELHYQPLLLAETGRCAGFEALIRLSNGKGGYIPPSIFIPVAEQIGVIAEIGTWVIEEATQVAATWPEHLFVSVNLSVKQFEDERLVPVVKAALAHSGLKPGRLELEVTESMLMKNTVDVARQLSELRALGVSIAMDDFGTGYSSLGYLWQFGFNKLKIDRSFVSALDCDERKARDILDTIIVLGHKLDMKVTAEGIETENQADILNSLSCDHFQGYLYGRPAPAADIAPFLLRNLMDRKAEARSGEALAKVG